jgi:hypothetical protein
MFAVVKGKWLPAMVLGASYLMLSACAPLSFQPPASTAAASEPVAATDASPDNDDERGWWRVGLHRSYHEGDEVLWHLDALIADEVFKPLVAQYREQLSLWRFHRRAGEDAAGHKFSFIFYSTRHTAAAIYQAVKHNRTVKDLLASDWIERLSFTDIEAAPKTAIEATSDKAWPLELQKSWPYFIMGVSRAWLDLVSQFAHQERAKRPQNGASPDVDDLVALYAKVHDQVNDIWQQQGGHAFLHHLNALFGYQELYIIERRKTRF